MKVLITGVTGFVGGAIFRAFSEKKRHDAALRLVATARRPQLPPEFSATADEYVPADLAEGFPTAEAEVCIHAAGLADDRSTALELNRANVEATRNLLGALNGCRLFVFISSASVYGLKDVPLKEDDATAESALSDYGHSKWAAEEAVREVCNARGIAHVILRPRAIYGAGDRVLLPRLKRLMRPPVLLMPGDGEVPMSLTYIGHLSGLIDEIVFGKKLPPSGTFNVADAYVYKLRGVLSALYTAIHHSAPHIRQVPLSVINGYVAFNEVLGMRGQISRQSLVYLTQPCLLDCTRARDVWGYAPSSTLLSHVEELAGS